MVGSRSTRHAQVWLWVAELGAVTSAPMSVGLLCDTAAVRLGVDGVTLAVDTVDGWPETRYATETLGGSLAELQVTVGEGPYADARQRGAPVLVDDLDTTSSQRRWPLFAPLAVEAGARALFTLPLCVGAVRVGVLALHRVRAGLLPPTALADALTFAELALGLLLDENAGLPAGATGTATGPALLTPQVHQATGMIAAQLDVSMAHAFARLRARAFVERRPLAQLATDVVGRRVRFDPTDET
ncbi:MAG TPA: GAF and ANTAR domain-containing protein [Pseudonocardiaceae bacterium]